MINPLTQAQNTPTAVDILTERIDFIMVAIGAVSGTFALLVALFSILATTFGIWVYNRVKNALKESEKQQEQIRGEFDSIRAQHKTTLEDLARVKSSIRDFVRADAYYTKSEYGDALKLYEKANKQNPDDESKYRIARCLTYLGNQPKAIKLLTELKAKDSKNPLYYRGTGFAARFDNAQMAMQEMKTALRLCQDNDAYSEYKSKLRNDVGLLYRDIGDYDQCLTWHSEALKLDANDAVTLYFLAIAKGLTGDAEQFRDVLQMAAKNSDNVAMRRELWADIIIWSNEVTKGQVNQAKQVWTRIKNDITCEYMEKTVRSNLDLVSKVLGVSLDPYQD